MNSEIVWVLDSSALINTKRTIAPTLQWRFFERMKILVQSGVVCFPKAVRNELHSARHVDTPEAWSLDVAQHIQRSYEPLTETVAEVMGIAGSVVDPDAEEDPADPYVLAQALEILRSDVEVRVVTDDVVDRLPLKIALSSACELLEIPHCSLSEFFAAIGFDPKVGWSV